MSWFYNLGEALRLASVLALGTQVRDHFCRCHWGMGECRWCWTMRGYPPPMTTLKTTPYAPDVAS